MRAGIDISEVETATKIRARYLRAIENEEWGLLPGPTFVKSFLRTYAEYLGLDAKLLVDEYKLPPRARPRPGPASAGAAARARAARAAAGAGASPRLGDRPLGRRRLRPADHPGLDRQGAVGHDRHGHPGTPTDDPSRAGPAAQADDRQADPGPEREVYVCLRNAAGELIVNESLLPEGGERVFSGKRFRLTVGRATHQGPRQRQVAEDPGHRGAGDLRAQAGPAQAPARCERLRMSTRAGILITGTEVLSGRVTDRNGPWLSERLRELGVDLVHHTIVGDRPEEMLAALRFLEREGVDLIVTSGGLGPTADDLTAEVVGAFSGREMVLDEALEERIAEILRPLLARWPQLDEEAIRASNRKQAVVPQGATILEPVGTAPGLVVPPAGGAGPTVVVLPGPPRELHPMWEAATRTEAFRAAIADATTYHQAMLRMFGIPESELAASLRAAEEAGIELDALEITTCLRRGELEMVTRYEPAHEDVYHALEREIRERHADTLFSHDGSTVDEQVAALLRGPPARAVAVAESCTGGLVAARLTERPGASDYFAGGVVAYADEAKRSVAAVPAELIAAHGAVSTEVARALADGAIARFDADVGVGVTGVAGPGGGPRKARGLRLLLRRGARPGVPHARADASRRSSRHPRPLHDGRDAHAAPPAARRARQRGGRDGAHAGVTTARARLFVALDLPGPVRDRLHGWARRGSPGATRCA